VLWHLLIYRCTCISQCNVATDAAARCVSGIKLQENPTLQYLYYLAQIGLAMCPVSNDALFLKLDKSPIGNMFKQGLNISFGTVRT
jgi:AMP deaminase